jgi:hypothetical protein
MEKIAVFVNDAEYARHLLQPMLQGESPTHWVLIGCPPTLSRHICCWVSHSARQQWRERWAAEIFAALEPSLIAQNGNTLEKLLATRPLVDVSARLQSRLHTVRLLDARRPRLGRIDEPITAEQPAADGARWAGPVAAATGLTAMLALAD